MLFFIIITLFGLLFEDEVCAGIQIYDVFIIIFLPEMFYLFCGFCDWLTNVCIYIFMIF